MVFLILGAFLLLWTGWIEPRKVIVKRFEVGLKGLRSPLKCTVIGDIQPNSYHWPKERLQALFQHLATEHNPDLVLWLGDYYNAPTDLSLEFLSKRPEMNRWIDKQMPSMPEIAETMSYLNGRLGSYAVLGNHDWAWSGEETQIELERVGVVVLKDEIVKVVDDVNDQSISIVGYEDVSSGRVPNYRRLHSEMDQTVPHLGLSHSPDAFPETIDGPPLMLSGHTHGGQVRIPFIGALVLPIVHQNYDMGWFKEGSRRLFVTVGLGTSLPPLRLFCPPEVVILTLNPVD